MMKRFVVTTLLSSLVLPACINLEEGDDPETSEDESAVTIIGGGTTSPRTVISQFLTSGDGYSLFGGQRTLHARLVNSAGVGIPGKKVMLTGPNGQQWSDWTSSAPGGEGLVSFEVYDDGNALPTLAPRHYTWSFDGDAYVAASTATFTVSPLRTDCKIEDMTSHVENGKQVLVGQLVQRVSGSDGFGFAQGNPHTIELSINGTPVGTTATNFWGTFRLDVPPSIDHGTILMDFPGDATIAGCANQLAFDLTPAPVQLRVKPYMPTSTTATIGASSLWLTVYSDTTSNPSYMPWHALPNTHVAVYAVPVNGVGDRDLNQDRVLVGEVTTGSTGSGQLLIPITHVVGAPKLNNGYYAFEAEGDATIDWKPYQKTKFDASEILAVYRGNARITVTSSVTDANGIVTRTYKTTNPVTNQPIKGLELRHACWDFTEQVTDANGVLTCAVGKWSASYPTTPIAVRSGAWIAEVAWVL